MDDRSQHFIQIGSGLEIIVSFLVFKGILELSQIAIKNCFYINHICLR